jgi:hypothetical protein
MSLNISDSSDIDEGTCMAYGEVNVLIEEDSACGSEIRTPWALPTLGSAFSKALG